ncbi:hypothetical protein B0H13DRAFT_1905801 [Mycena leptocephala]|nr:hypothetical protein B0H13DRAFT_1905801 [Mycena leptocephala]
MTGKIRVNCANTETKRVREERSKWKSDTPEGITGTEKANNGKPIQTLQQNMQKLLNSRGQEQNGQIGTKELSQNVAGLGLLNQKGRGKWQGREARMLALYSLHGDSAAVRRFCGRSERITAPQREMCCESTWVWPAEESSQMERLQDRRGKINRDRATWGNCTAERAK